MLDETVTLESQQEARVSCPSGYVLDPSSVTVQVVSGPSGVQYTVFDTEVGVFNPHPDIMVVRVTGTCPLL